MLALLFLYPEVTTWSRAPAMSWDREGMPGGGFLHSERGSQQARDELTRNEWEDERRELLLTLDSALASGFAGLRTDVDQQTKVLSKVLEELKTIKERLHELDPHGEGEPARRKGEPHAARPGPLDRIK